MRGNFHRCLERLWAEDADGPGRRLGLSRRTLAAWRGCDVSRIDLDALQKGEAAAILHVWFWRAVAADELPEPLDAAMFELAVRRGPKCAAATLQRALKRPQTGELTAADLRAVAAADLNALLAIAKDGISR